jgi:hypothetical protein
MITRPLSLKGIDFVRLDAVIENLFDHCARAELALFAQGI